MHNIGDIYFSGYKSFEAESYTNIRPSKNVNLIIGKNNSGKSSIVDILEFVIEESKFKENRSRFNSIDTEFLLDSDCIEKVFDKSTSGGNIVGNHYSFGKKYIGQMLRTTIDLEGRGISNREHRKMTYSKRQFDIFEDKYTPYWDRLSDRFSNFFSHYKIRRLNAERNIVSEIEIESEEVYPNGDGASNLVRKFINYSEYDEKLIEETLLIQLNKIMNPDSNFTNIRVQQVEVNDEFKWEIFLEESNIGRFALSQSGSGLKTIILILLNLLVIPKTSKYKDKNIVYAFEEVENNLHPALQRRVFEYLYEFAVRDNIYIFLTTHSHVAINTYFEKEFAQILHVSKENNISKVKKISNYLDKTYILDDLDVKASDLLQSNGIIWVEGPSDRIYIKKWLEVFCKSEYTEGTHYQFLYYGGRLLAHYTADEHAENLINILLTNRNSAIVIDSDNKDATDQINVTKRRVQDEFSAKNSFCWITKGKEIENYVSKEAIELTYDKPLKNKCGQYELFPNYIKDIDDQFTNKKVKFAKDVAENITLENSKDMLDLKKQVTELYDRIKKWNNC